MLSCLRSRTSSALGGIVVNGIVTNMVNFRPRLFSSFAGDKDHYLLFSFPQQELSKELIHINPMGKPIFKTLDKLRKEVKRVGDESISFLDTPDDSRLVALSGLNPKFLNEKKCLVSREARSIGIEDSGLFGYLYDYSIVADPSKIQEYMTEFGLHYPDAISKCLEKFARYSIYEKNEIMSFFAKARIDRKWIYGTVIPSGLAPFRKDILHTWKEKAMDKCDVNFLPLVNIMNNVNYFGGVCHAIYMHDVYQHFEYVEVFRWRELIQQEQEKKRHAKILARINRGGLNELANQIKIDTLYFDNSIWDTKWFWPEDDGMTREIVLSMYEALGSIIDLDLFMSGESSFEDVAKMITTRAKVNQINDGCINWLIAAAICRKYACQSFSASGVGYGFAKEILKRFENQFAMMRLLGDHPRVEACGHSGTSMAFALINLEEILCEGWEGYIVNRLNAYKNESCD